MGHNHNGTTEEVFAVAPYILNHLNVSHQVLLICGRKEDGTFPPCPVNAQSLFLDDHLNNDHSVLPYVHEGENYTLVGTNSFLDEDLQQGRRGGNDGNPLACKP